MSLNLSISAKETKVSIVINECTGKYNGNNKGGWGTPNKSLSTVTSAAFEIYAPGFTSPATIGVSPDFPTDDTELGYEVFLGQIGVTFVESGEWRIGYRVKGVSNDMDYEEYTETSVIFVDTAQCCVDKLIAHTTNVPVNVFMKDDKKKAAVELAALMKDAKWAKKRGHNGVANRLLKFINLQCECC